MAPGVVTTEEMAWSITKAKKGARPPAVIVDVGKDEFPVLVQKLQKEANQDIIGNSVVGMRQAKNGDLLIQIRGDANQVDAVRQEVTRSAGTDIEVRALQNRLMVEVRDLNEWTTREEIQESVSSIGRCEQAMVNVISLRKQYDGVQVALVLAPQDTVRWLSELGHVKVGMVYCCIRECDKRIRCYKCLAYGHDSKICRSTDQSKCC